jgi:hypothetical protein
LLRSFRRKSTPSASFALFILPRAFSCAPTLYADQYAVQLHDQDWTIQGHDKNLITITIKPQIHQSLVATSYRHISITQHFCPFTSIVNGGCGLLPGRDSTVLPPLLRQCLRRDCSNTSLAINCLLFQASFRQICPRRGWSCFWYLSYSSTFPGQSILATRRLLEAPSTSTSPELQRSGVVSILVLFLQCYQPYHSISRDTNIAGFAPLLSSQCTSAS